ncbi:MAG: hypothetical protein ACOZF0_01330 [Thermodesulfobacteriota bacterium]
MPSAHGAESGQAAQIEKQQRQIDEQARMIESLRREVAAIKKDPRSSTGKDSAADKQRKLFVESGNEQARVRLYGQINRGVLYTDDGEDGNFYHVDNDNSSTRIGLSADLPKWHEFRAGAKLEFEFQSNDSNLVSQIDKNGAGDNHFRKRHLDFFVETERYGRLSVGYGDTASNSTAEVDLSGTDVIGYSSVSDMAGGHFFYSNKVPEGLTNTTVRTVFVNMDGLGRDDRIRYDSPEVYGIVLSGSNVSGGACDAAIRYNARIGEFRLASAAAFADFGDTSSSCDQAVDSSLSVLHDSGLSGTFAAGRTSFTTDGKKDGKYAYLKGGYQKHFFQAGLTALAVDIGCFYDVDRNGDTAKSIGLLGVQQIDGWSTDFYIGCRNYDLDRRNDELNRIIAVLSGVRLKF